MNPVGQNGFRRKIEINPETKILPQEFKNQTSNKTNTLNTLNLDDKIFICKTKRYDQSCLNTASDTEKNIDQK